LSYDYTKIDPINPNFLHHCSYFLALTSQTGGSSFATDDKNRAKQRSNVMPQLARVVAYRSNAANMELGKGMLVTRLL
jgi:hypothetical protein